MPPKVFWHNQNLPLGKISILIKTRISIATSCPLSPPPATAQSPKRCPYFFVAVKIVRVVVVAVA
jgi:hypothetical protein